MKPVRIQRSRQHKQTIKAKYCGRPGKFGNPFKVGEFVSDEWRHKFDTVDTVIYFVEPILPICTPDVSIDLFKKYLLQKLDLTELKNNTHLSCWCALDKPCHVDAIIEKLQTT